MPKTIQGTGTELNTKTYDGNKNAAVKSVILTSFANGESLTLNMDYTSTTEFADENTGRTSLPLLLPKHITTTSR